MLGPTLEVRAPAKINLALRVLGLRRDGYHELDTVFQTIDLWDRLVIAPSDELSLACDDPRLPDDAGNLVFRAAALLREHLLDRPRGAAIRLYKSIPLAAGLGGGSSDAAATLLMCARFWEIPVRRDDLLPLAETLGADVPFFLYGGTARGRGRGDRIEPLRFAGETRILLGVPPFGVSTAEAFSRLSSRLTHPTNGVNLPALSAHKLPAGNDFWLPTNDLEQVVFDGWPALEEFRDAMLAAGAERALLSGSGSTVYGVFAEGARLRRAAIRLRESFEGWKLIPTRAVEAAVQLVPPNGEPVQPG